MTLLRESVQDFHALLGTCQTELGYPAAFIERDYWITEILRSLAQANPDGARIIFKGGTSLLKAWKFIERMSEDVDILVVLPDGSSKGAHERALKGLTQRIATDTGLRGQPRHAETSVHRATEFPYEQAFQHAALTGSRVLVELGTRGGPEPNQMVKLEGLMAQVAIDRFSLQREAYDEFREFEIATLVPERTLLEKFAALHHFATQVQIDESRLEKIGTIMRHAYDIAMILGQDQIRATLVEDHVKALVLDIEERSQNAGWPSTPRPAAGYAASPAFKSAFLNNPAVLAAYERVIALVFGQKKPTLSEVAALVRQHGALL